MTTGPADEQATPPRRLRASHIDREQAISALKAAFVHGRLAKDEFDARVGQALAARTHAELAVITADIPAAPIGVQPVRRPNQPALGVKSGVCMTVSAALLAAALWAAAWSAGSAAAGAAALAVTGVVIFTLFVTGYQVRESRHHNRSGGPLPPGIRPFVPLCRNSVVDPGYARPRRLGRRGRADGREGSARRAS